MAPPLLSSPPLPLPLEPYEEKPLPDPLPLPLPLDPYEEASLPEPLLWPLGGEELGMVVCCGE